MGVFRFKRFSVTQDRSALKVGTDAVLLGAAMTIPEGCRNALDIGTGTGVIALMAAQRMEGTCEARITGIDIDAPSAEEAAANFAASPWSAHLASECTALACKCDGGPWDLIFSNPPYYDNSLRNPDEREATARHTGSLTVADICSFASANLAPSGQLSLILPSDQERALLRTAASFGLYAFRIVRIRTSERKSPRRIIAEFALSRPASVREELLTLGADTGALTGDFYL